MYWRAYAATVWKGRRQHYALAVIRRALTRVSRKVGPQRVRVTADRGFADVALFTLLTDVRVACVIRVKKSTTVCIANVWRRLDTLRCGRNTRQRALGSLRYCAGNLQPLWGDHESDARWAGPVAHLVCGGQSPLCRAASRGRGEAQTRG
jgi:hypothetical protein